MSRSIQSPGNGFQPAKSYLKRIQLEVMQIGFKYLKSHSLGTKYSASGQLFILFVWFSPLALYARVHCTEYIVKCTSFGQVFSKRLEQILILNKLYQKYYDGAYIVYCTAGKLVTTVVVCKILNRETHLEYICTYIVQMVFILKLSGEKHLLWLHC